MCDIEEDLVNRDFRDTGGDWFGNEEVSMNEGDKALERREREDRRLGHIRDRLERDELDFEEFGYTTPQGETGEGSLEGRRARLHRVEAKHTQQEIDAHMATHIPFRSWCAHLCKGQEQGSRS